MSRLTTEQLSELTERINRRLAEFGEGVFEQTTAGVVRLVVDVIDEWRDVGAIQMPEPIMLPAVTPQTYTTDKIAIIGNGHHASQPVAQVAAVLGPEHTIVTPLKNGNGHHAPTELDDDLNDISLGSADKADLLREVIAELQMMSKSGEMPGMALWDEDKPAHLPKAAAICARYNLNWGRLAEYARLTFSPRRGKGGDK